MPVGRTSARKRQRELDRQENQRQKAARRAQRPSGRGAATGPDGEDPDLAGIVPGPQPPRSDDA